MTPTTISATPTAVATSQPWPQPPPLPVADPVTFAAEGYMAFVQDETLYIQDLAQESLPVPIDSCAEVEDRFCRNLYLKWSPDGQFLLYHHIESGPFRDNAEIRLATPQGERYAVGTDAHGGHPAAWSPDGSQIVYLRDTRTTQSTEVEIPEEGGSLTLTRDLPLMQVITIPFENGETGTPQINGTLTLAEPGCGGGYSSRSAMLYGDEGGTALGYLMGILEWTAPDILLFTANCTNAGIDRYDMSHGTELEPLERPVRNLALSPDKSRWYGVAVSVYPADEGANELVTGDPTETAVTTIPTAQQVEMVFVGQKSGHLFVTSRVETEKIDTETLSYTFYETTLFRVDIKAGTETAVYRGEDFAIAHVQEAADGTILFVQIENDVPRYEAAKMGVSGGALDAYNPRRHIVALDEGGTLLYIRPDAGTASITP